MGKEWVLSPSKIPTQANVPPAIYLIAFGPLLSVFSTAELDELCATMVERQIRIRHDIEGYLEGWVSPDVEERSDLGEQEVEALAAEHRRLMPF